MLPSASAKRRKQDRRNNLNKRLADGSWDTTKCVRKKYVANPACLRDTLDASDPPPLRSAAERASVYGEYLKQVQFGKSPGYTYTTPVPLVGVSLAPPAALDHPFHDNELVHALRRLKNNRSSKPSGVPGEVWKLVINLPDLRADLLTWTGVPWWCKFRSRSTPKFTGLA